MSNFPSAEYELAYPRGWCSKSYPEAGFFKLKLELNKDGQSNNEENFSINWSNRTYMNILGKVESEVKKAVIVNPTVFGGNFGADQSRRRPTLAVDAPDDKSPLKWD